MARYRQVHRKNMKTMERAVAKMAKKGYHAGIGWRHPIRKSGRGVLSVLLCRQ